MKVNNVSELIVKYNDKVVGYLKELKDKHVAFQYGEECLLKMELILINYQH